MFEEMVAKIGEVILVTSGSFAKVMIQTNIVSLHGRIGSTDLHKTFREDYHYGITRQMDGSSKIVTTTSTTYLIYIGVFLYSYIVAGSASTARQSPQSEFIRRVLVHFYLLYRRSQVPTYVSQDPRKNLNKKKM